MSSHRLITGNAVIVTVLAAALVGGFRWDLAVSFLPSIDSPDMRGWLDIHHAGGERGARVVLAAGCPAAVFDSAYREMSVPPREYVLFAEALRAPSAE